MNCIYTCNVVTTSSSLRSAVICFYLSNEGVSLLENAAHLGLPVPEKLKAVLSQLHNKDDSDKDNQNRIAAALLFWARPPFLYGYAVSFSMF